MMQVSTGLEATASAEVTPGPLRRAVAREFGISTDEVTDKHVADYLIACDEEGRHP